MVVYSDVVVGSCVLVATRKAGKLNFLSFWDVGPLNTTAPITPRRRRSRR